MIVAYRRPALLLALTLAACKPTAPPAPAAPAEPAKAVAAAAAVTPLQAPAATCPDSDFEAFLKRFVDDAAVQRSASADPLTMESIDAAAEPEPAPMSKQVALAEVTFPVMPAVAAQAADGFEMQVTAAPDGGQQVTVRKPDTGIQTRYGFRQAPCWTLVRVSDDSF